MNVLSLHPAAQTAERSRFRDTLLDAYLMLKRNLLHIPRTPELLIDVTVQPIIFVLLFRYVFGGAIAVEGGSYVNYLMAGIFVQTLVFTTISTGVGLANDLTKGLIDRFRSLPMSRSAVLIGRTATDLLRGMLAVVIMLGVGLAVGFRPSGDLGDWAAGFGLLLLFSFAVSWIGVTIGMLSRSPEAVQATLFIAVFPLTFASSAFVPVETMPSWLQSFAEHQPVTLMVDALRHAVLGQSIGSSGWQVALWSLALLVIFFPTAVYVYAKRTSD
jgi:ABC-2 type transport system permease protein/oleandomycin transport system permease protein